MGFRFAFGKRATNISKQSRVLLAHNSVAANGKPRSRAIHPISARSTEPRWKASRRKVFGESSSPIEELELELKKGQPDDLFRLARTIERKTEAELYFRTKSERGYKIVLR